MVDVWIHIDNSVLTPQVIVACRAKHRLVRPDNELSVTRNVAGTQAIVKISDAEPAWRNALPQAVKNAVIRVYTPADHGDIFSFFYGPEWQVSNGG